MEGTTTLALKNTTLQKFHISHLQQMYQPT